MPFALLIIGIVLLIAAVRNTYGATNAVTGGPGLGALLQNDFTGSNNFVYWVVAILIIGALGYIPKLKPLSVALLTLVIIVLLISKGNPSNTGGGFFQQLTTALGTTTQGSSSSTIASTTQTASNSLQSLLPNLSGLPNFAGSTINV